MIKSQGSQRRSLVSMKELKAGMNQSRVNFEQYSNHPISINAFWLLGFVEGGGTFGMKDLVPYFQLPQKVNSERVLHAIEAY